MLSRGEALISDSSAYILIIQYYLSGSKVSEFIFVKISLIF